MSNIYVLVLTHQRRKRATRRGSFSSNQESDNLHLIKYMTRYVEEGNDKLRCLVAKYLAALVTETSYLDTSEVDIFIKENGHLLIRM